MRSHDNGAGALVATPDGARRARGRRIDPGPPPSSASISAGPHEPEDQGRGEDQEHDVQPGRVVPGEPGFRDLRVAVRNEAQRAEDDSTT